MKFLNKTFSLALLSGSQLLMAAAAVAATTASVGIRFDLAPLRNGATLSTLNFGSGFEFENFFITQMFDNASWQKSYADMGKILAPSATAGGLRGVIRFPNGDASQTYFWNDYQASYSNTGVNPVQWLTPDSVIKYFKPVTPGYPAPAVQAPIPSEIIFEINAFAKAGNTASCYLVYTANSVHTPTNCPSGNAIRGSSGSFDFDDANESGLKAVAQSAAAWYRKAIGTGTGSSAVPLSKQPDYWEIGNEEWNYWSADKYAEIVTKIGNAIIQESLKSDIAPHKPLKFLIQSHAHDVYVPVGNQQVLLNTKNWTTDVASGLNARQFNMNYILGVSEHRYISGDINTSISARTSALFNTIDTQEVNEITDLKGQLNNIKTSYGLAAPWQLWVTEYNIFEQYPNPAPAGFVPMQQTQAHGLIMADWTARMLSLGVDRVLPLSADFDPQFALFNYANNGGTGTAPIMMPGGTVFSKMAGSFVGTMEQTTVRGNSLLTAYATYDTNSKQMQVMLVNRDQANDCNVTLGSVSKAFAPGVHTNMSVTYSQLNRNSLDKSNVPPYASPYTASNPPIDWINGLSTSGYQWMSTQTFPGQNTYYQGKSWVDITPTSISVPASSVVVVSVPMN